MAVPATGHYKQSLDRGDTLAKRPHLHWVRGSKTNWIRRQQQVGKRIVVVELSDRSLPLFLLEPARESTVLLLGHEGAGVPDVVIAMADDLSLIHI